MKPGTKIVYKDIAGTVTNPPYTKQQDTSSVWIVTQDGYLLGVPANSEKLQVVDSLPGLTAEEHAEARKCGYLQVKPEETSQAKLYLRTGFIKLPETSRHPAGLFKIIAGGMGQSRTDVSASIPDGLPCVLINWRNGEGYFAITLHK